MFKLYRFENMLYSVNLTGKEILRYLEFSCSGWFNTMKNIDDHLLAFRTNAEGEPVLSGNRARLKNQPYNFDSAAGIDYIVDVSKPAGERVKILRLSDGRPFDPGKTYRVAVNSYRGNGGGGHFYEGAGLGKDELRARLITSTDKDLRYYIMKNIEMKRIVHPEPLMNWKIIPEEWARNGERKDFPLLFGKN
jgi:2',3'-cyclic-nucleotide 2'-phosphodiesterase/3'-nucleotidase